ncbi:hypothetical protein [Streptomyces sp. cmx-18-6]|uniref:hypothetical protein n=1 Tax=Streptomyces sp. cmx-18-6 TaxID=2790930 RepID=UPI0039804122
MSRRFTTVTAVAFALILSAPTAAHAAESSSDFGPQGICDGGWKKNVYGYKSKHHGSGPIYKDGPGGEIWVSKIKAGSTSTTVGGKVGVEATFAVGQAKAEISRDTEKSVSWSTTHTYKRKIASKKYGNVQYGSWGHTATWEKYYELPNCKKTQRTTKAVKLANKKVGFRYWETKS